MIAGLRPYPSMKGSGLEWLGGVPEHWEVERAKNLFNKVDRPVRDTDDVVTCFRDGTVTLRKNRRTQGFTESLKEIGYQGIRSGDLVIHAMDAFAGAVGVSDSDGKGTPVYAVCEPLANVDAHYHAYVIREMARSQWILALATGIRERSTDFRFGTYAEQRVPLPPLEEQAAIVKYLDHADRRIRRLVQAKRKLIALLTEQKQAIIHRAVTRGLDPGVSLKDSGVEWLGQVPEHWDVAALRLMYEQCLGKMLDTKRITGATPLSYLRNTDVQWDRINITALPIMDITPAEYSRYTLRPGDLLVCEGGEIGRAAIWPGELEVCGFQKALHRLRPRDSNKQNPRFMFFLLRAACGKDAFSDGHVSTIAHLTGDKLRAHRFPFPPFNEQVAIVEHLDQWSADIETAIGRAKTEIKLLNEYRARLVADVVTGKLDVRAAAATLPEVNSPDDEPELDDTLGLDADEDLEELDAAIEETGE